MNRPSEGMDGSPRDAAVWELWAVRGIHLLNCRYAGLFNHGPSGILNNGSAYLLNHITSILTATADDKAP